MNIILLQTRLSQKETNKLFKEFPHFLYLSFTGTSYKELNKSQWPHVEIIYGNRLTKEELAMATQLRWVHTPSAHLNQLCYQEIIDQGNILVTTTKEENIFQIGEYVMSGILAFSKNLFHWQKADQDPRFLWDSKLRESMWSLKDKLLLQIGLGANGTEITRQAQRLGMRVQGAEERKTFHPHCHNTIAMSELHQVLPTADVVCLTLPMTPHYDNTFTRKELELMKEDSILIIIGSSRVIKEDDLAAVAATGKFRGVMIDSFYQIPISTSSPLWKIPNVIITPEVSPRPKSEEKQSFQLFRFNLRQYLYGNFSEMRNISDETIKLLANEITD